MKDTEVIAQALEKLTEKLDGAVAGGRRPSSRDSLDDSPRGVDSLQRGRREDPLEIQAVLFQVRVPVGRRGETMPAYLQFGAVRDQAELEDLAEMVRREFPDASVYQAKREYGGRGYGGGNGYGRGGFRSDRDQNGRW